MRSKIFYENLCKEYNINNYTINDDMSISVNGNVDLSYKNLKSIPIKFKEVGGHFSCYDNQLTNFDGLPEFFERPITLFGNPVDEIYKLFNEDPRCIYWIREFGTIQGDEVVRDRLEEVYHTLGMEVPKDIILKEYILT